MRKLSREACAVCLIGWRYTAGSVPRHLEPSVSPRPRNVFVVGLDEANPRTLRAVPHADGYSNVVTRLLAHLDVPRKGLIDPWSHQYPHLGEAAQH